jgi:type IV secretory pathway VirB9-like protein
VWLGLTLAALFCGGAATSVLRAQDAQSTEVLFRQGYAEIIYDPEYIPTLGLKQGIKTLLLLPSDEKIVRVEPGVRGTAIEIKYGTNWVALRPNIEKLTTNIHIATDKGRVYSFDLVESGGPHKEPHKKVVILRPDMELDSDGGPAVDSPKAARNSAPDVTASVQTAPAPVQSAAPVTVSQATVGGSPMFPAVIGMEDLTGRGPSTVPGADVVAKLDADYKIKNQTPKVFKVERVYNDGQRTFVVFKTAMLEAPLFYRIDSTGKREILTYRMEPSRDPRDNDVFVIPRLVDRGTVKVGDYESTFVWKKVE